MPLKKRLTNLLRDLKREKAVGKIRVFAQSDNTQITYQNTGKSSYNADVPGDLEKKAMELIAKQDGNINFGTLTPITATKNDTNFFFRWEDKSRTIEDVRPFVQVGYTQAGDLLSCTNTLGL